MAELAGQPQPELLLLNDDDLTYAKVRLDPVSEATVLAALDRIADPMARALCWTALWNSARDAETPATRYVDAVTAFGPSETGIGVLLNILENASTAVEQLHPAVPPRRCAVPVPCRGRRPARQGGSGLRPPARLGADGGCRQPVRRRPPAAAPGPPGRH